LTNLIDKLQNSAKVKLIFKVILNKNYMKKIYILAVFILILVVFFQIPGAKSSLQPYYSGEAINFRGKVIIGTINTGALELFSLENNHISKVNLIQSPELKYPKFYDLAFSEVDNRVYLYLTNGRYLYKYDVSDLHNLKLVNKLKDNSWDFFVNITSFGDKIATIGTNGLKVWNSNNQVINSFKVNYTTPDNIKITENGNFIYKIYENKFRIIDSFYREIAQEVDLQISDEHIRNSYFDDVSGAFFVVDDDYLNKIYLDGRVDKFKHISNLAYDVDALNNSEYLYFSDGVGIVKSRKSDLEPIDWRYTTEDGGGNGWAMGLRVVGTNNGDNIIVFNGSSIVVYDRNLEPIDYYMASEEEYFEAEPATIKADRYQAWTGQEIYIYGQNFANDEFVEIEFNKEKWQARTNNDGIFSARITVPEVHYHNKNHDIKATGMTSSLSYSISFTILE